MALVRFRIKQMGDPPVFACGGIHFDLGPTARRLEPTEVLELDDAVPAEAALFEGMYDKGLIEMVRDMPTRPLHFTDAREAQLCSPEFVSSGPNEDDEMEKARDAVAARLNPLEELKQVQEKAKDAELSGRARRRQLAAEGRALEDD
jgi:hypothetical protein